MINIETCHRKIIKTPALRFLAALVITGLALISFESAAFGEVPTFSGVPYARQNLAGMEFSDINGHWAKIAILRIASLGIMKGTGDSFYPNASISRQELIATIVRLLGREEDAEKMNLYESGSSAFNKTDFNASAWAYGYLQAAMQEGIISSEEGETLDWKEPVRRQEAALWLVKALGLSPMFGNSQQILSVFRDYTQIDPAYVPYVAAAVNKGFISGRGSFISPKASMTRAEAASVLDRVKEDFPQSMTFRSGQVLSTYTYEFNEKGQAGRKTIYELIESNGQRYNLEVSNTVSNGWENSQRDFIVFKDQTFGLSERLKQGDFVKYAVSHGQVLYAEVIPQTKKIIRGEISYISPDGKSIYIVGDDGFTTLITINEATNIKIDERTAAINDLAKGQQITAGLVNGMVQQIAAISDREPGYIAPGSLKLEGTVASITKDGDNYEVVMESYNGTRQQLIITPFTSVIRSGQRINSKDLRPGEQIIAYFSSSDYGIADRVTVNFKGSAGPIYKARIAGSLTNRELLLENVSSFYYGSWVQHRANMKIHVAEDVQIYANGRAIDIDDIASYRQEYAYIACSQDFGQDVAVKIIIKCGDEYFASGDIDKALWSQAFVEVKGIEALFGEDAIITAGKDFTGIESIDEDGQIFLLTNKDEDINRAVIIMQPEFYDSSFTVSQGNVDEITRRGLEIDHYKTLENNSWSRAKKSSKSFDVADDAYIIDATDSTIKLITPEKLSEDRFEQNYYDDYAYILSRDEKAFGILLLEEAPDGENLSLGQISQFAGGNWIKVSLLKDYNSFRKSWNSTLDSLDIDFSRALLVRKGEIIEIDDLKVSDRLYLIRDNNVAILGFVLD